MNIVYLKTVFTVCLLTVTVSGRLRARVVEIEIWPQSPSR